MSIVKRAITYLTIGLLFICSSHAQEYREEISRIVSNQDAPPYKIREELLNLGVDAVPALIEEMERNPEMINMIASVLGTLGDDRATPSLISLLGRNRQTSRVVVVALGSIKDPMAVEPLIGMLQAGMDDVVIESLRQIGDSSAMSSLLEYVESSDNDVIYRISAASVVMDMADGEFQGRAADFLVDEQRLRELFEAENSVEGAGSRFPLEEWWLALVKTESVEAYEILTRAIKVPYMEYDFVHLVKAFGEIQDPPQFVIDAVRNYAVNGDKVDITLRLGALRVLAEEYGVLGAAEFEELLGLIEQDNTDIGGMWGESIEQLRADFENRSSGGFSSRPVVARVDRGGAVDSADVRDTAVAKDDDAEDGSAGEVSTVNEGVEVSVPDDDGGASVLLVVLGVGLVVGLMVFVRRRGV